MFLITFRLRESSARHRACCFCYIMYVYINLHSPQRSKEDSLCQGCHILSRSCLRVLVANRGQSVSSVGWQFVIVDQIMARRMCQARQPLGWFAARPRGWAGPRRSGLRQAALGGQARHRTLGSSRRPLGARAPCSADLENNGGQVAGPTTAIFVNTANIWCSRVCNCLSYVWS